MTLDYPPWSRRRQRIRRAAREYAERTMPENSGLYQKFTVHRNDGRDQPGGDRAGAVYFVLDILHDPYARAALGAYAESCVQTLPDLARELYMLVAELETQPGPMVEALRTPREGS